MAAATSPIPPGHHTVTPHLVIGGAAEALEFYKKAFGAVEVARMPGPSGKLMHAEMKIGDSFVYLADEHPEFGSLGPKSVGGSPIVVHLYVPDADKIYNQAVAAGATPTMPLMDMFWGDRFGKLVDPFGHHWSIATHKEDFTPEEMMARSEAAMKEMCKAPA